MRAVGLCAFADAPGGDAHHLRADPGAVGAVAEQQVGVVRAAHEFGERLDLGGRVVLAAPRARTRRRTT